jgi:hypothetical protein
MAACILLKS